MLDDFRFSDSAQLLRMPYVAQDKSDDVDNGFLELAADASLIDCIHEVREFPELRQLLLDLIPSSFISWRVDTGIDASPSHFIPGYDHVVFSMLTVICKDPEKNSAEDYLQLLKNIRTERQNARLADTIAVQFFVTPTVVEAWNYEGVCLDIWIFGYGATVSEARSEWALGLENVAAVLLRS